MIATRRPCGAFYDTLHVAGDSVGVANMERALGSCGETARIVSHPAPTTRTASAQTYFPFAGGNFEGAQNLLSEGTVGQSWDAGVRHEDTENTFKSDSFFYSG